MSPIAASIGQCLGPQISSTVAATSASSSLRERPARACTASVCRAALANIASATGSDVRGISPRPRAFSITLARNWSVPRMLSARKARASEHRQGLQGRTCALQGRAGPSSGGRLSGRNGERPDQRTLAVFPIGIERRNSLACIFAKRCRVCAYRQACSGSD